MYNMYPMPNHVAHELCLWENKECYEFYVQERIATCNFMQRLDLVLLAPYCDRCIQIYTCGPPGIPDISPDTWEEDLEWKVGRDRLLMVRRELRRNADPAFQCKRCATELRPWEGDEVHVVTGGLEDLYSIPICPSGRVNASKKLKAQIVKLYGGECFNCGHRGHKLYIDHILPRRTGGNATFGNLQPLCEVCGQLKGNSIPEDVCLICDMHFGPYPSDGYEGLFW